MSSVELSCSCARVVCSRGYKLVGRGCQTQVPQNGCSVHRLFNPCNDCPPLPFIAQGDGYKGKENKGYNVWSLKCLLVRSCLSGRIELKLCYFVVGAAAWLGGAIHTRTLGAPFE
jgi:hypothetical protein